MGLSLTACVEWLFEPEHKPFAERVHAAKAAGLSAVEFHLWRDKPLDAIERALDATGVRLSSFCVDPRSSLVDPREHDRVLQAVRDAIPIAKRFNGARMILASGFTRPDVSTSEQQSAAVAVLKTAAALAAEADTVILLEPVNMTVNGATMFVDGVQRGLDITESVDSPGLRVLCDVYHSAITGEDLATALGDRMRWVGHVQVADTNGRHEPGTGGLSWPHVMGVLREKGYNGEIGLEYLPSLPSLESLALARRNLGI
jgi:hydroxypyruvate isomerase